MKLEDVKVGDEFMDSEGNPRIITKKALALMKYYEEFYPNKKVFKGDVISDTYILWLWSNTLLADISNLTKQHKERFP